MSEEPAFCKRHGGDAMLCRKCEDEYESRRAQPMAQADETQPPCKTHPDAPHGFNRHASLNYDRYVCDCEFWEPIRAAQPPAEPAPGWCKHCRQYTIQEPLPATDAEPVAWRYESETCGFVYTTGPVKPTWPWKQPTLVPLFAHPPRPEPLSDEQITWIWVNAPGFDSHRQEAIAFARAIEAAIRAKGER